MGFRLFQEGEDCREVEPCNPEGITIPDTYSVLSEHQLPFMSLPGPIIEEKGSDASADSSLGEETCLTYLHFCF